MKKEKPSSFSFPFIQLIEHRKGLFNRVANHRFFRNQNRAFPLVDTVLLEGDFCRYANPIARLQIHYLR